MNLLRLAVRAPGKRLPKTSGTISVPGIHGSVEITRDRFGVPYITAGSDADAWFALGFCHGQDRPFQLALRQRIVRGTLAQLVGPDALPIDHLARRIGFRRHGEALHDALAPAHRLSFEAYAAGATTGVSHGLRRLPHPFVLLRAQPTPYEPADALGFLAMQAFVLASNWDVELARLMMLRGDGPEAVIALDPTYPDWLPVSDRPGEAAGDIGPAVSAVAEGVTALAEAIGLGGGSNNWAVAPGRTASGRAILANDPHLAPMLPPHWYLAHIRAADWAIAGASFPGAPIVPVGHNGTAAWGVTAGLTDTTDLFLEEIGPDGRSVLRGDRFVPCETRVERIDVRGGKSHVIEVLTTDRGPIVGPAFEGGVGALSIAATWLRPADLGEALELGRMRTFDDLRTVFAVWPAVPLNVAFASDETIGWQLVGDAPVRKSGVGAVPLLASDSATSWHEQTIPTADLPHIINPEAGFVATANNLPTGGTTSLGVDFLDGYRVARITEALSERSDWDVAGMLELQMDHTSIPWREMRGPILEAAIGDGRLALVVDLLRNWDGVLAADSAPATIFEVAVSTLARRVAEAKAPNTSAWALGRGFSPLVPMNGFIVRRISHLSRLMREQPDGWFTDGWSAEIRRSLHEAVALLTREHGKDPNCWTWGSVRPLTLRHPLGLRPPLDRVFNLGPIPHGGDANTINPAPVNPADPTGNPDFAIASLRFAVEIGDWDRARFVLPGGQSGNPFSRHYADQLRLWRVGDALVMPWSNKRIARAARKTLRLVPG